jgi:hypothetical protein
MDISQHMDVAILASRDELGKIGTLERELGNGVAQFRTPSEISVSTLLIRPFHDSPPRRGIVFGL